MRIKLQELTCQRCGWHWLPRKERVRACPNCHSVLWDLPLEYTRRAQARKGKDNASV